MHSKKDRERREPALRLHITTSEEFSETQAHVRPSLVHASRSSLSSTKRREDKFGYNPDKEELRELRQARGDVVVVHGDKVTVFRKSSLQPTFALPGQQNLQNGFRTPANREYSPVGEVENPKNLVPPALKKATTTTSKQQYMSATTAFPPVGQDSISFLETAKQRPSTAAPTSPLPPGADGSSLIKSQYFEFPPKEIVHSTLRLEKVKKGETFVSELESENDLSDLLPEPRLKTIPFSFCDVVDDVTRSFTFFATETGADNFTSLLLSSSNGTATATPDQTSNPSTRPSTQDPNVTSVLAPPSQQQPSSSSRPRTTSSGESPEREIHSAMRHEGQKEERKGLTVSIDTGTAFSAALETTRASWDPAFGRYVSSIDLNPSSDRSGLSSREHEYGRAIMEFLSPYSTNLYEVERMKEWAKSRGFAFERLSALSFAVLDEVINLIAEAIPHDKEPLRPGSSMSDTPAETKPDSRESERPETASPDALTTSQWSQGGSPTRKAPGSAAGNGVGMDLNSAGGTARSLRRASRSSSTPPIMSRAVSAGSASSLGVNYFQNQFALTKKELSAKLNEKLAARHKNREYVYRSSRYLSTLSSQASEDAENWQCYRVRPSANAYVDMWRVARARLTEEQNRARIGVVFYARLLTFLDFIGAPTSSVQLAVIHHIRRLLIEGCPVDERLFFELIKCIGADSMGQRETVKIIHFMRIELKVDVIQFFKEAARHGWQLSGELAELKARMKAKQIQTQQEIEQAKPTPDEMTSRVRTAIANSRSVRSDKDVQAIVTRVRSARLQPQKTFYSSYYNNFLPPVAPSKRNATPQQQSFMNTMAIHDE